MTTHRLGFQPGEVIDRSRPISFHWNGKKLEGFSGDTIVSAMLGNDRRIFSRSMKYHRPRVNRWRPYEC